MKFRAIMLMLSLCAAISPVSADIPPPPVAPKAIAAFADDKPNCLEWTDGCTICKKQGDRSRGRERRLLHRRRRLRSNGARLFEAEDGSVTRRATRMQP